MIEEMALVLITEPELNSDIACVHALLGARFRARDIVRHLDEARAMARRARIDEATIWAELNAY